MIIRKTVLRCLRYLPATVLLLAWSAGRLAADDGYVAAAPVAKVKIPWQAVLYALTALAGIAVVGFKNAKRTHLD